MNNPTTQANLTGGIDPADAEFIGATADPNSMPIWWHEIMINSIEQSIKADRAQRDILTHWMADLTVRIRQNETTLTTHKKALNDLLNIPEADRP